MALSQYPKSKNMWLIISLLLAPLIILLLGILLYPDIFYDQFIWRYFWGPIVEDALNRPVSYNGVIPAEKFTLVSELIYGVLVLGALLGLYRLLKRWVLPIDFSFLLSVIPFIIYGSVARVLEDAEFFTEPLVYWFVTPLIYFQSLLLFLLLLFIGHYLEKKQVHPMVTTKTILFIGGLGCLIPTLYYVSLWMLGHQWSATHGVRLDVLILVLGLVFLTVIPVYLFGRYIKPKDKFKAYADPLNLSMLFGHMLDGIGTYISIYDPLQMGLPSYYEKHPASDFLLQLWPPLFPIVKFLLIIVVIYVFDVLYKEEMRNYPLLASLLKIGIFILGFAPGLRSVFRVCMGV
ncbi:MAG: DUF63 family protein [Candidatus Thermoplasmatota archaeon]|nr:DUF63 family protein [Candidatus Thermoplasmatota archaeon]